MADTSLTRAWSLLLAAAQFHKRTPTDPDTRQAPAPTTALLAEPTSIGVGLLERGGECLKHGACASSHGAFLHVAAQTLKSPAPLHYISRDHPNTHEFTNHILHPSPESGLRLSGPWKVVAQVVWNGPCVAYWYNQHFSEATLNQNDIQNWFPVVELI